jgi:hypothetical protein
MGKENPKTRWKMQRGRIEREQIRGRRRRMDLPRQQVGNSDRLRNGERRSTGNSRRIQNRRDSKIMGKFQHVKLTKESNKSTLCNRKKLCIAIIFL